MYILGISAFYHDSAAALICNGDIIAAAQEERFTRKKHDAGFPKNAIHYCLSTANISIENLEYIVFYDKPLLKFERLIETYLATVPNGFRSFLMSMPLWIKEKLFQKRLLIKELQKLAGTQKNKSLNKSLENKIIFTEHHQSHAASAFYPSPLKKPWY